MNTDAGVPSLFSLTPGASRLSINGMPPPGANSLIVPLGIVTLIDGNIKIKVSELDPTLASMKIQLIDSVAGTRREIALNGEYSSDLKAGDHSGRILSEIRPGCNLCHQAVRRSRDSGGNGKRRCPQAQNTAVSKARQALSGSTTLPEGYFRRWQ